LRSSGSGPDGPASAETSPRSYDVAVEHLRSLQDSLRYWYQTADTKAQVVLTINGLFLTVLAGSILTRRDDVARTVTVFGPETWVLLAGTAAGFVASIFCAVMCLAPRGVQPQRERRDFDRYGVEPNQVDTYKPEVTVFFALVAQLQPEQFAKRMRSIDKQFVVNALASDTVVWSREILHKHRWVERAFIFTAITLGFFMCVAASYVIRISLAG
jgi:hypothetical protein